MKILPLQSLPMSENMHHLYHIVIPLSHGGHLNSAPATQDVLRESLGQNCDS